MAIRFGKYIVESEIGRGGFGKVYRAFDADMNRRVAIKILVCESDADLLSRFHAEAGMTANLAHKNIVTVFEFAHQDGCPYLVMELLEGRTLYEMIAAGESIPLLEKAEIMYQVAEGLQHAHARGVIHRDIKPGNIMVLPDGRVKIMDFGIARVMHKDGVRRTREGDLIGTVPYMAPEIFRDHQPDKKTDIFAYGVLYYELLTGEHPFQSQDPYSAMTRILNEDPPPVRNKLENCPEGLEALIQRLLMKDRETRFDELNDVLFDTEPVLRELRQERAGSLAREVEPLMEQGKYEIAYSRVKQILDLDPACGEARLWREQIRNRLNRQRADRLRQQGLEHMSAMRFKEAVTCFESALHLETDKSEISALLARAKAAVERTRRSSELIAMARSERQQGQIEEALSHVSEAVKIDPSNTEAASLLDSLRTQLRELRMRAQLKLAEDLRSQAMYDEALAALDEVDPGLRDQSDLNAVRARIIRERRDAEQRRRTAQFQEAIRKAQETLDASRLKEALEAAETICQAFPEQSAASEFRSQVRHRIDLQRQTEDRQNVIRAVAGLLDESRFDEARSLVGNGLASYPGEPVLQDLAKRVETLAAEHHRTLTIERVLRRAEVLREEGEFERALDLVEKAIARLGNDSGLNDWRLWLKRDLADQEHSSRERSLRDLEKKVREALAREHLGSAEMLLSQAERSFSKERLWISLKGELSQRETYRAGLTKAEERCAAGDFRQAKLILEKLRQGAPDDRAERLHELTVKELGASDAKKRSPGKIAPGTEKRSEKASMGLARAVNASGIEAEERRKHTSGEQLREQRGNASGPVLSRRVVQAPKQENQKPRRKKDEKPSKTRDEVISEGRLKAAALAREGNLVTAVAVLESLGKRYPNSSEIRHDLEAAKRELSYQRDRRESGPEGKTWTKRRRQIEKQGRDAAALLKEGDFAGAMALIKGLLKQNPK